MFVCAECVSEHNFSIDKIQARLTFGHNKIKHYFDSPLASYTPSHPKNYWKAESNTNETHLEVGLPEKYAIPFVSGPMHTHTQLAIFYSVRYFHPSFFGSRAMQLLPSQLYHTLRSSEHKFLSFFKDRQQIGGCFIGLINLLNKILPVTIYLFSFRQLA